MKEQIKVPAVGESITEATVSEWVKHNGDYVNRDDVLLVLETDKASVELVAEHAGQLNTQAEEGDVVAVNAVLGSIDTDAAAPAGSPSTADTPAPAAVEAAQTAAPTSAPLSPAVRKIVAETGVDPNSISGTARVDESQRVTFLTRSHRSQQLMPPL